MGEKKVREKKKPTFFLAVLPILAMIPVSYTHLDVYKRQVIYQWMLLRQWQ